MRYHNLIQMPPYNRRENLWTLYRPDRERTRIFYDAHKHKYTLIVFITEGKYKGILKHHLFWDIKDALEMGDKLIADPDGTLDATAELYGERIWLPHRTPRRKIETK